MTRLIYDMVSNTRKGITLLRIFLFVPK